MTTNFVKSVKACINTVHVAVQTSGQTTKTAHCEKVGVDSTIKIQQNPNFPKKTVSSLIPIWSYISCNESLFSHLNLRVYFMQWIFIFPSDPIFHTMNFSEFKTFSIWIKHDFVHEFLKTGKFYFLAIRPLQLITRLTCSELWHRFRNVWLQAWLISLVLPL